MKMRIRKITALMILITVLFSGLPGSVIAQQQEPTAEPADEPPEAPSPEDEGDTYDRPGSGISPYAAIHAATGAIQRVSDINPAGDSFPQYLEVFNNKLYFSAKGNTNDIELWVYDGVHAPTLAWNINPGSDSYPQCLKVFNGKLYFSADGGGGAGRELWAFDGTNVPYRVADICPAACSSYPQALEVYSGYLIFSADGGDGNGRELWMYDGVNPPFFGGNVAPGSVSSYPNHLKVFNNDLYFAADGNDGYGFELWAHKWSMGLFRVSDIYTGGGSSDPGYLEIFNNRLYFSATSDGLDHELWSFDGVILPYLVSNINPGGSSNPKYLKTFNNQLYFSAKGSSSQGYELWAYDGSHPPYLAADIYPGSVSSDPEYMEVFKSKLFFGAIGPDGKGKELWSFTPYTTATYRSPGAYDGYITESSETSSNGGSKNNTASTFRLGDDAQDRQYRAILHFNTANIPDNAVIASVQLKIKYYSKVGISPFSTHGKLYADIRKGPFSGLSALQIGDFQAAASKATAGSFVNSSMGGWYTLTMPAANLTYLNKTGVTQFRLRFARDDNDDRGVDYLNFFSGDSGVSNRPQLIVKYYMP